MCSVAISPGKVPGLKTDLPHFRPSPGARRCHFAPGNPFFLSPGAPETHFAPGDHRRRKLQAAGLTSEKGGTFRLSCWTADSSFLASPSACPTVVRQTPSWAFVVPPQSHRRPHRAPLILSLLTARTPCTAACRYSLAQDSRQVAPENRSRPWLMNGGTASEAQRWDEGAKRPKGLKGQACLLPELLPAASSQ